ncbi:hypothetical protein NF27_FX00060 [Candidatus Jidaibacter acanthamoeba]|uniref:Secreted protein n=1 Tax=Candidatus Jidaibacter acanthamoebae TaxID=86105 RepID=A0A0C1QXJ2_9RICK|nr:hypothetical protein [Candidatus Jidaibacter acanthamoeba]KIE04745.1 hypothetical protein NF27_FX00060 [Candidatus Jidaibacter acanthamoeba]
MTFLQVATLSLVLGIASKAVACESHASAQSAAEEGQQSGHGDTNTSVESN